MHRPAADALFLPVLGSGDAMSGVDDMKAVERKCGETRVHCLQAVRRGVLQPGRGEPAWSARMTGRALLVVDGGIFSGQELGIAGCKEQIVTGSVLPSTELFENERMALSRNSAGAAPNGGGRGD